MSRAWDIEEGRIDAEVFFGALPKCLPDASTIVFEGTSFSDEVKGTLSRHAEAGPFPQRQTLWPRSNLYRCKFSAALCFEMRELSKRHAEPELCDHLSVFRGEEEILAFHDFGANNIYVSGAISEEAVSAFATALGLKYREVNDG